MAIKHAIERAFKKKLLKGWDKWPYMYWAIDLHDVIIPGTYTRNNEGKAFYPNALEVLQWLGNRDDMKIILFTSSHKDSVESIIEWMQKHMVGFDYFNENPECANTELCDFSKKFYFDIMLEDKAGFEGMEDWLAIKQALIDIGEWHKELSH